jgi:methylmalonyl-CoA mutase cobalamin-binding subunit
MVRVLLSGPAERASRELRDTGHEVVLAGPGLSADQLAAAAIQEDVVAVALVCGAANIEAAAVPAALAAFGAPDIVVLAVD